MLKKLSKTCAVWVIHYALQRKCPPEVMTSGNEAKKNNCYWAYIWVNGEPFSILEEDRGTYFSGRTYDGHKCSYPVSIPVENIRPSEVFIRHLYRYSELTYSGAFWYISLRISRLHVFYVRILALHRWIRQRLFNLRAINMLDRLSLLEFAVNRARDKGSIRIEPMLLMSELFSERWVYHPDGMRNQQYLEWLLDSVVKSGEIHKTGQMDYQVTPIALATLDALHRDQRRHRDMVRSQRVIALVTAALVAVGIFQSGLGAWLISLFSA